MRTRTSRFSRPGALTEGALDGDRRLEGRPVALEDGEELIGSGVDLAAASLRHRLTDDGPDLVEQDAIAVTEPSEEGGG
jgi:hypothetical protein